MDNVYDDLKNRVDTIKNILYKMENEYLKRAWDELNELETYIQSLENLGKG